MKIVIGLGHPAHYHLFKDAAQAFVKSGHDVLFVLSPKDVLLSLVKESGYNYASLDYNKEYDKNLTGKLKKIFVTTRKLLKVCRTYKPDLLIGCMTQLAYIGSIIRKPVIFFAEDDFSYSYQQGLITYPFVDYIISPTSTSVGPFKRKKIGYPSFQKLSYLHPNRFTPDVNVEQNYGVKKPYIFVRMVGFQAQIDSWSKAKGLTVDLVKQIINEVSDKYRVYISSEKPISSELKQYELKINPTDVHHILANSTLFIGDSQSMTVESAMLGVPSIRYNNYIGVISVLEELEHKYELTFGISSVRPDLLMEKIEQLLSINDLNALFQRRRLKMLEDKIDITAFITWLIENYPDSVIEVRKPSFTFERFK